MPPSLAAIAKDGKEHSFASLVFGRPNMKNVMGEIKVLLLKLFCSLILEPDQRGTDLCVRLGFKEDEGAFVMNFENAWEGYEFIS